MKLIAILIHMLLLTSCSYDNQEEKQALVNARLDVKEGYYAPYCEQIAKNLGVGYIIDHDDTDIRCQLFHAKSGQDIVLKQTVIFNDNKHYHQIGFFMCLYDLSCR